MRHQCLSCVFNQEGCNICNKYIQVGSGKLCGNYKEKIWFSTARQPSQEIIFFQAPQIEVINPMVEVLQDFTKIPFTVMLDQLIAKGN